MSSAPPAGTVLAFDFGTQRIGVAVGESRLGLAHPLTTIANAATGQRLGAIEALIAEWKPALLVVGLPTHADGGPHAMTARARRFAHELEDRFALPVKLCDERFTTRSAAGALREAGARGAARKSARDRVAAQLILQAYFDQRQSA
jgi:putative Holliday junction resolvase